MITNPTTKGKTTEAIVLAALVRLGKSVLLPWGEERYDLAIDDGGRLVRIQCKTGALRKGCVVFKTCITDVRRPLGDGGYAGQVDAFAVFCPELNRVYMVPIEARPQSCPCSSSREVGARALERGTLRGARPGRGPQPEQPESERGQ